MKFRIFGFRRKNYDFFYVKKELRFLKFWIRVLNIFGFEGMMSVRLYTFQIN